jgi:NAD(P)-dependent dehydrogenase (short-subunit alcohol dehydrogenase family)
MNRFAEKVVLVTGASSGIGLATVERIRAEGGTVVAAVRQEPGSPALDAGETVRLDVTDEAGWDDAVAEVLRRHGRLDVLVNNAGARGSGGVEETSLALWRELIDVNLTSVFLGCRAAVPAIRASGGGAIVVVGSITGIRGTERMVAYSASKSGLVAMTASLALDLAPDNIRVNGVAPAAIDTRMVRSMLDEAASQDEAMQRLAAKHPIGRIGRPEEVASVIAFLASADAAFMTGLTIPVDGGRSIR